MFSRSLIICKGICKIILLCWRKHLSNVIFKSVVLQVDVQCFWFSRFGLISSYLLEASFWSSPSPHDVRVTWILDTKPLIVFLSFISLAASWNSGLFCLDFPICLFIHVVILPTNSKCPPRVRHWARSTMVSKAKEDLAFKEVPLYKGKQTLNSYFIQLIKCGKHYKKKHWGFEITY